MRSLIAADYEEARETSGGGPKKDFFANRDQGFREHKARLIAQLRTITDGLRANPQTDLGYVKVTLRRSAWAKSHRPLKALFKADRTPIVGGADIGVMLVEARPQPLLQIANDIAMAEDDTRLRLVPTRGKEIPYPSPLRSETSAIERIEIYGESDRRGFSLEEAVAWLSNPITGGSYEVELFDVLPPQGDWDALTESHRRLFQSFVAGLTALGEGLMVQRLPSRARAQPLLSVRVSRSAVAPTLRLGPPPQAERRRREVAPFDPSQERHRRLLAFLDRHPLVRKVSLPGVLVRTTAHQGRVRPSEAVVPVRDTARTHPKIGVIDLSLAVSPS